jgi:AcrR family transcriptional regulator
MSPARARTSLPEIVAAGRALLESGGLDALTMQAVAERVGIRAPSLYKHVRDRAALLAAVADTVLDELGAIMAPPALHSDPAAGMRSAAMAFRAFAMAHPRTYEILFANLPDGARGSPDRNAAAVAPVLMLAERMVGPEQALEAARLVTAFAHGFISMELAGAFRLGGDLDTAFRYGVDVLVESMSRRPSTVPSTAPGP